MEKQNKNVIVFFGSRRFFHTSISFGLISLGQIYKILNESSKKIRGKF